MRTVRKPTTSYWKPFGPAGAPHPLIAANHRNPLWGATPAPAVPRPPIVDTPNRDHRDHHDMDEHWTAVTAHLADMYFPNEG